MKAYMNGITCDGTPDEIRDFLAKYEAETPKKVAAAPDTLTGELFAETAPETAPRRREIVGNAERMETEETEAAPVAKRQRRRQGVVVCYFRMGREQPLRFYRRLADLLAEYYLDDSYTGEAAAVRIAHLAATNGRAIQTVTMWRADGVAECWIFDRSGKLENKTVLEIQPAEIIDDAAEVGEC